MKKRGALFYIIDAFVAAGIIAITLTIIFSSQINTPETEQTKDVLNNYYTFISKTKIYQAPGTLAQELVYNKNISNIEASILGATIELASNDKVASAQQLMYDVTKSILPDHYGVNISLGDGTVLYTKNEERKAKAESSFTIKRTIMYKEDAKETMTWKSIATTGNAACTDTTCLYATNGAEYDEECSNQNPGWTARCSTVSTPQLITETVEVTLW